MISAFLFSPRLPASKPGSESPKSIAAAKKAEGKAFPPKGQTGASSVRAIHFAALALAFAGLALLGVSGMSWTHDPANGLSVNLADVTIRITGAVATTLKGALS